MSPIPNIIIININQDKKYDYYNFMFFEKNMLKKMVKYYNNKKY